MADPILYPNITDPLLSPIRVLRIYLNTNPDLFDRPECPYTEDTKRFLKELFDGSGSAEEKQSFLARAEDKIAALREQIAQTLDDVRDAEKHGKLDQKDRVQLLKAKPALLEKLIELEERAVNVKTLSDFMKTIYRFVDKDMDPDQRTKLMKALDAHLETLK